MEKTLEDLIDGLRNSSRSFDGYIITFATGALGLSFAFMTDVIKDIEHAVSREYLIVSWVLFVLCIMLSLVEYLISMHSHARAIGAIRQPGANNENIIRDLRRKHNARTFLFKYLAFGLLIAGILCSLYFVVSNFQRYDQL